MSLLGVDVGTTGCKVVSFTLDGNVLASAYREYRLIEPKPGWLELDPYEITKAIKDAIADVASNTKRDPISALSVSCMGEAAVLISKKGEILYNSIISFDARTADIGERWAEMISPKEIFQITGMPLHPMYTVSKLMWLRENEPQIFKKIWKSLCYEEYVFYLLGVEPVTDYSLAARTMAFDNREKRWSQTILEKAGLNEEIFAKVVPSGQIIGKVDRKVADELGLPHGVLAVTGGHDQPCNALGSGIIKEGAAAYGIGTVECITVTFDTPKNPSVMLENNFQCYSHVVPDLFVTLGFNFTGGSLLKWYRDTFAEKEREEASEKGINPYDLILADLPDDPSPVIILPHFTVTGTPHFDTHSKGAILGLTLGTKKNDIVKAILEGVTFEIKQNAELMAKAGIEIREMRATGGGAKSRKWIQLKADIMGIPIASLNVSEATSLGTAILAGVATGLYQSFESAVEELVKVKEVFYPDPNRNKIYKERFEIYKKIYPALRQINQRL